MKEQITKKIKINQRNANWRHIFTPQTNKQTNKHPNTPTNNNKNQKAPVSPRDRE